MNNSDAYLTEYYQRGTGDQFFPGCPSSVSIEFRGDIVDDCEFFPSRNRVENDPADKHTKVKKTEER